MPLNLTSRFIQWGQCARGLCRSLLSPAPLHKTRVQPSAYAGLHHDTPNRRHIRPLLSVPYQLRAHSADVDRHIPSGHTKRRRSLGRGTLLRYTGTHGEKGHYNTDDSPVKQPSGVALNTGDANPSEKEKFRGSSSLLLPTALCYSLAIVWATCRHIPPLYARPLGN